MRLFGFEIKRTNDEENIPSFVPKETDDGAVVVAPSGAFGTYVDLDGTIRTEAELVNRYRDMSLHPEVAEAIDAIVNEAFAIEDKEIVEIVLDDVPFPPNVKQAIEAEFSEILRLLNFRRVAYETFRRWYIDGRLYYHVIIDTEMPELGIKELRYIDPRKIRKVREVVRKRLPVPAGSGSSMASMVQTQNEYYVFSDAGFNFSNKNTTQPDGGGVSGLRIAKDSILHVTSGLTDTAGSMVLSYLHKAIKPLNQLRAIEDASVIYRLSRAPERRVWYIDIGNLPKMKAEQYVREIMVKHKNRLTYDASTGEIRDDRKFMCYSLDTKIPLLDGRTVDLQQLIEEYNDGKTNWAYSCDPITGAFVPGPISWAGVTKRNSQVVRVTFDNGKSIICTPDHKFPVWGKGMIEAKDLVGESIIPGYRRNKEIVPGGQSYEQIFKNDTKTWEFTHREVARWKNENGLREDMIYSQQFADKPRKTIHHRNYNRFDNSPNNLVIMNRHDHIKYHADNARGKFKPNRSEDFTPEWRAALSKAAKLRNPKCKTWKVTTPDGQQIILENLSAYCRNNSLNRSNIKGKFGSSGYRAEQLRNHKAVSVEWLEDRIDVGCITIDLEETYHSNHTYLLDAGVYTKNTMLEDYWLPRREGGRGTEVSTLPAGQNLGEIEDIEYFLNKLYKSLNVPITRLQSDATFTIGRVTELTRDEITFTRFIERLRHRFSVLFIKALEKQLVLKNIVTIDDWNQIDDKIKFKYNVDNYFAELKQLEILQTRLGALQLIDMYAGKYYSHEWIRRNVLQQSEEDINIMDQQISMEMENPQYIGMNAYDSAMNTIQGMQGQDGGGGGQSPSQSSDGSDEDQDNLNLVNVKATYDNLKKKGANRTQQEDYMFHSAAQLMFHHWREKPKDPKKTRLKLDRIK